MSKPYPMWRVSMYCRMLLAALLLAGFAGSPAAAQPGPPVPRLVKDINTTNLSSTYLGGAQAGSLFFFFVCNPDAPSLQLWKTDGSEAGTVPVAEKWYAVSNQCYNAGAEEIGVADLLFFVARDMAGSPQLWKSDGTDAGTVPLSHFTGYYTSTVGSLTSVNHAVYFIRDGQLWQSDGTDAGTVMVKDGGVLWNAMARLEDNLFFFAEDAQGFTQLWKTGGIEGRTVKVKDFPPDVRIDSVNGLKPVGGRLFFGAADTTHAAELWVSDGTDAGTVMVKDINLGSGGSGPASLVDFNSTLFFSADDGYRGRELWKSDGTEAGTVIVKDIFPGRSASGPYALTPAGARLFLAANTMQGPQLWHSDGTEAGTTKVRDIGFGGFIDMVSMGNAAYYFRNDSLWKSDGTNAGTAMITNVGEASRLTVGEGTLYFSGNDGIHGRELWKSDGTEAGTLMLKDLNLHTAGSHPLLMPPAGGRTYFIANDRELWRTDGTEAGTIKLMTDRSALSASFCLATGPGYAVDVNGTLFFRATDQPTGLGDQACDLWKSDGTVAGTMLVKDLNYGAIGTLTNVDGTLFFTSNGALWKSDGTTSGTVILKNGQWPGEMVNLGGRAIYGSADTAHGAELWKSDGTPAGTMMVKDINPGTAGSGPTGLTPVGRRVFFAADDGVHGAELWQSDGTEGGTRMVKDLTPGSGSSLLAWLTAVGGNLLFMVNDDVAGTELWKSDGTETGTVMLKATGAGAWTYYGPPYLADLGGTLFFMTDEYRLWKSDGTEAGTVVVKEGLWQPRFPIAASGKLFFVAGESEHGLELWQSDGTETGTKLAYDIWPGAGSASPQYLKVAYGTLYFQADDGFHGAELWALDGRPGPWRSYLPLTARN